MISTLIHEIGKGTKNAAVKKRVISFFMKNGYYTLPDLAKSLGLSIPTITNSWKNLSEWASSRSAANWRQTADAIQCSTD